MPKFTSSKNVVVPDCKGKKVSVCEKKLHKLGFEVETDIEVIESATIEKNKVVKTKPEAGRNVKQGTKIVIYKSGGEEVYEIEDYTGKNYIDDYNDVEVPSNVKLVPYMENFINVLKDTDLIVSRAGASTIAEITAIGLPAILVPSPYVTHNHQYMNAKELEDAGACTIVTEDDFSKETIIKEIDNLLHISSLLKP